MSAIRFPAGAPSLTSLTEGTIPFVTGWNVTSLTETYFYKFPSVDAGEYNTCGVKADGTSPAGGIMTTVSQPRQGQPHPGERIRHYTCGVKTDGTVACWGDDGHGQVTPPAGKFTQVAPDSVTPAG